MTITMPKVMNLLVHKMNWHVAKTQRINQNIANHDTPGYKRQDIKSFEVSYKNINADRRIYPTIQDSEEVNREHEMLLLTETAADYQTNMQLFKKYLSLMKTVIGNRNS